MGCFSYICKQTNKPAISDSFNGDPVHLYYLINGVVVEHMYGNYDSYGRVFRAGLDDSFKWARNWSEMVETHFNDDPTSGFALELSGHESHQFPTTISDDDPNQGWGKRSKFKTVEHPFHMVYVKPGEEIKPGAVKEKQAHQPLPDENQELQELKQKITNLKEDYERRLKSAKEMIVNLSDPRNAPQNITTNSAIERITTKASTYRTVLTELNKLIQ